MEDALLDGDGDAAWDFGVKGAGKKRKKTNGRINQRR